MTQSTQQPSEDPEHQLFAAIALIKTPEEAQKFFHDLCTPAEISAMADRWRVVHPIKAGVPYRTIYEQTGVSATTVGRVARFMTHGTGGYDLIYQRQVRPTHEHKPTSKNRSTKKGATQ